MHTRSGPGAGLRRLAAGLAVATAACITPRAGPWAAQDRAEEREAAMADPGRLCPVIVENVTDDDLDVRILSAGARLRLGVLPPGESREMSVRCAVETVVAVAQSRNLRGDLRFARYRKVARLDVLEPTILKVSLADQVH